MRKNQRQRKEMTNSTSNGKLISKRELMTQMKKLNKLTKSIRKSGKTITAKTNYIGSKSTKLISWNGSIV